MKTLCVVVDMQNDFVYGSLGSKSAEAALPEVVAVLNRARAQNSDIAFTLDTHGADYHQTQEGKNLPVLHCVKGTAGHELAEPLKPYLQGAKIFEKNTFGSVALGEFVQGGGYEEVTLCGVCTDICVVSNALLIKAFSPECRVKVISLACAGTSAEAHAAALKVMRSCQIIIE